jgi:hypothetical protein
MLDETVTAGEFPGCSTAAVDRQRPEPSVFRAFGSFLLGVNLSNERNDVASVGGGECLVVIGPPAGGRRCVAELP